jgi:hypothetical protein
MAVSAVVYQTRSVPLDLKPSVVREFLYTDPMSKRAFLRLAPNQVMADVWAAQLKEAGYPVDTAQPTYPYPHAGAPVEIWLLDGDILEMPGVRERIDELLDPVDPEELPEEFTAEEPPDPPGKLRMWHLFVGAFVLLAIWVVGCGRTPDPDYAFLKGALVQPVESDTQKWLSDYHLDGQLFVAPKTFKDAVKEARSELAAKGFAEDIYEDYAWFWKVERKRYVDYIVESFAIYPYETYAPGTSKVVKDTNKCTVVWGYEPSNAQRIGNALGL